MKFEDVLRESQRMEPHAEAAERWRRAVWPEVRALPLWVPGLASGVAMAAMLLLLWPAAARGPLGLRAAGMACDGRGEHTLPLRADVRGFSQPIPSNVAFSAPDRCGLCHLSR